MVYEDFYEEQCSADGSLEGAVLRYPANFNFAYDVLDPLAESQGEALALLWRNDRGIERRLSFSDMARLSRQAANVFLSLGLQKGDVVTLVLRTHYEYWYLSLAAHRLGLIVSPIFHLLSPDDFRYRLQQSGSKLVITTPEGDTAQHLRAAAQEIGLSALYSVHKALPGFQNFSALVEAASDTLARQETKAEEPILLYFTSGTTGEPKGVLHDHAFILPTALGARYMQGNRAGGLHFATGNTGWEVVCGTKFYGQWLCGCAIFVYDYARFSAPELLEQLAQLRVTSMMAQPTVYRQLLDVGMDRYDLSSLECLAVGGEKLTRDVSEGVFAQTGKRLHEGYAQSEAGLIAACSAGAGLREGSMGRVLPKYHVEILRPEGGFAAPLEHGEIVIVADEGRRPVGLLSGYWQDPEASAALWDGDIFHTGDEGYMDADGFLYYLGRADGLIKTRGYRVSPFEIENELARHEAVYEVLAVGAPDARYGQHIRVFVRLRPGFFPSETLRCELLDFHNAHCSAHKKITRLHFVSDFLRNNNHKIIRKQFEDRPESDLF